MLFKGSDIPGDMLSGTVILIDKYNGEMRLFNAGRQRDRDAGRTAKLTGIEDMLSKSSEARDIGEGK